MNLRCLYCQTPFTLSRVEMLSAIVTMNEKNQNHYDAHCPRCRRANSISRQRMELFFPNWREAAKQAAAAAETAAKESAAVSVTQKTEPLPKAVRESLGNAAAKKATLAEKAKPAKSSRASKPESAKKTTPAKSPAKTKTTAKPAAKTTTKSTTAKTTKKK